MMEFLRSRRVMVGRQRTQGMPRVRSLLLFSSVLLREENSRGEIFAVLRATSSIGHEMSYWPFLPSTRAAMAHL